VNPPPQTLALAAAARFEDQQGPLQCVGVQIVEVLNFAQAVIGEFFREVAGLAGFAGRAHGAGVDGIFVALGNVEEDVAQVSGFAGELGGDHVAADVAFHAAHAGMGRTQVSAVFRRHGMASHATEFGRVGVGPRLHAAVADGQGDHTQHGEGQYANPEWAAGRRKKEVFDLV